MRKSLHAWLTSEKLEKTIITMCWSGLASFLKKNIPNTVEALSTYMVPQ